MSLCLASSEECELPCSTIGDDCACDIEKIRVVRAYVQSHFPDRDVREFHSLSTVMQGDVTVPCADHHVVSITDGRPCCAVLTREFLDQPIDGLGDRLRRWHLARALRVDGTVIVGGDGISPL